MSASLTPGRRLVVRVALGILALSQAAVGGWALLAPSSFFDSFPAAGHAWVSVLPPYNEHLVRDVGALGLALALVLAATTVRADAGASRTAALAFAAYAVPHTAFHALHLEGLTTTDAVAQTTGFVLQIVLVVVVLLATAGGPQVPPTLPPCVPVVAEEATSSRIAPMVVRPREPGADG